MINKFISKVPTITLYFHIPPTVKRNTKDPLLLARHSWPCETITSSLWKEKKLLKILPLNYFKGTMKRVAGKSSSIKISKTSIFSVFPAWYDTIFILLSGACGPSTLFHGLRSRCSGRLRSLLQSNARWNYILHLQVDFISSLILLLYCFCFWAKLFSPQTFEIHQFPLLSWNKQQKVRRHTSTVSSGLISYKCTQFLMLLHAILLESIQYFSSIVSQDMQQLFTKWLHVYSSTL